MNHGIAHEGVFADIGLGNAVMRALFSTDTARAARNQVKLGAFFGDDDVVDGLHLGFLHEEAGLERENVFAALSCDYNEAARTFLLFALCDKLSVFVLVAADEIPVFLTEPVVFLKRNVDWEHLNAFNL